MARGGAGWRDGGEGYTSAEREAPFWGMRVAALPVQGLCRARLRVCNRHTLASQGVLESVMLPLSTSSPMIISAAWGAASWGCAAAAAAKQRAEAVAASGAARRACTGFEAPARQRCKLHDHLPTPHCLCGCPLSPAHLCRRLPTMCQAPLLLQHRPQQLAMHTANHGAQWVWRNR